MSDLRLYYDGIDLIFALGAPTSVDHVGTARDVEANRRMRIEWKVGLRW